MLAWQAPQEQQMTAQLTVSNRQKRLPVDLADLEGAYERLRLAVMDNLSQDRPKHLKRGSLEQIAKRGCFSVTLVGDRKMKTLNRDWMGKDRPTDVLSFPLELEPPPPGVPWEVGEIVISVDKASQQASQFGHSLKREIGLSLCAWHAPYPRVRPYEQGRGEGNVRSPEAYIR